MTKFKKKKLQKNFKAKEKDQNFYFSLFFMINSLHEQKKCKIKFVKLFKKKKRTKTFFVNIHFHLLHHR